MVKIKKISIGSAFRVSAVVFGILWAVLGVFWLVFFSALTAAMPTTGGFQQFDGAEIGGVTLMFTYVCSIPIYAIIGGLVGALYAFIYNLTAGWVGGIEIELEDVETSTTSGDWGPYKPKIGDRDL